jgi:hypothetical protein
MINKKPSELEKNIILHAFKCFVFLDHGAYYEKFGYLAGLISSSYCLSNPQIKSTVETLEKYKHLDLKGLQNEK